MRFISVLIVNLCVLLVVATAEAQELPKDISAVFAAGKITAAKYQNEYFGLTLTPTNAHFTQGGFVNAGGKRARLIDAQTNADNDGKYEISILADERSVYPPSLTLQQYVSSVRHQFEKDGAKTVQQEFPIEVSGLHFVGATVQIAEKGKETHYLGIYSTFLNGYVLSLEPEATSEGQLRQIVLTMVHFNTPAR